MNAFQLLLLAWAAGLVLERKGDALLVRGADPSSLPPELMACLRENKAALLAVMRDQPEQAPADLSRIS